MEPADFTRTCLALALVIALIWFAAWIIKRTGLDKHLSGVRKSNTGRLAVQEVLHLDTKRKIMLVRADAREYLILLSGDTANVIERVKE